MRTGKRALVTWSALIAALFLCVTLVAFPTWAEPATASKTIGNMDEFKTNMENSDYYVQKGTFAELDTVGLA